MLPQQPDRPHTRRALGVVLSARGRACEPPPVVEKLVLTRPAMTTKMLPTPPESAGATPALAPGLSRLLRASLAGAHTTCRAGAQVSGRACARTTCRAGARMSGLAHHAAFLC